MKKMKKLKFLCMVLLVLLTTGAKAQNMQYLVFDLVDGSQTVVALADQPVITFQNNELKVTVNSQVKVQASLGDVAKYSFSASETPTAIEPLLNEESHLAFGHVYIANAKAGETVRVFTAEGHLVATQRIGENGTADIDLTTLGKGLLIVKSAKTSIKIMNK